MSKKSKRPTEHLKPYQFKKGGLTKPISCKNGFWSGVKDVGQGVLDSALTPLEAVAGDFYQPEYQTQVGEAIGKVSSVTDKTLNKALPAAAGIAATAYAGPQAGQAAMQGTQALQGASQQAMEDSGEEDTEESQQPGVTDNIWGAQTFELGGSTNNTEKRTGKDYVVIPKPKTTDQNEAANYKKEVANAKKKGLVVLEAPPKMMNGGAAQAPIIEVEGNELEVQNGKVTQDFAKYPKHSKGGYRYSPQANRVIIPSKMRDKYLEADKTGKTDIETNLIADQMDRDNKTNRFKKGGLTTYLANRYATRVPKAQDGLYTGNETNYVSYDEYGNPTTADQQFGSRIKNPQSALSPLEGDFNDPAMKQLVPSSTPENNLDRFAIDPFNQKASWDQMAGAVPSSPQEQGTNWNNVRTAGYYGAVAAPIAYNLYKGLQKPQVLKQEEFQNPEYSRIKELMRNRTINMKPVADEIRDSYRIGLSNIGKGAKSSGQVLSGQTSLWASRMNALAQAEMNAQDANNRYRGEEAGILGSLGDRYAQTKLGIQDINDRNRAARNAMLAKAAGQGSDLAQGLNRDDILYGLADQTFADYGYNRPYGPNRGFQYRYGNKYGKK